MPGFGKLAVVQAKLYLREPLNAFFTLAFGPSLLLLLGLIFATNRIRCSAAWVTWKPPRRHT